MMNKDKMDWKQYCKKLVDHYKEIDVLSIPDLSESRKVSLKKLYVPLKFSPSTKEKDVIIEERDLFDYHYLAILGDPGSGKSTWVWHMAITMAEAFLENDENTIPVPVILRDYMQHYQSMDFIQHFFLRLKSDLELDAIPNRNELKRLCGRGKVLMLLDGIDEVGIHDLRVDINKRINDVLKDFPGIRIWCTSRIVGYDEAQLPRKEEQLKLENYTFPISPMDEDYSIYDWRQYPTFFHIYIKPLNEDQIHQFIHNWYEIREWNPRERRERIETLKDAINYNERIAQLATNPLTLSMIAMVHRKLARLPEERAELYRVLTEALLEHWELQKYKNVIPGGNPLYTKLKRMEHLAEYMMNITPGVSSDRRTILLKEEEIKSIFKRTILDEEYLYRGKEKEAELEAENFLQYIKTRTGLLIERIPANFSFLHLSFQEYLTASYLYRYYFRKWGEFLERYGKQLYDSQWEEPLFLFFEIIKTNSSKDLDDLLLLILSQEEPPLHLMVVTLAGRPEISESVKKEIVRLLCRGVLMQDIKNWGQVQKDWLWLIRKAHSDPYISAVRENSWKNFVENLPGRDTLSMRRWSGYFIICEQWVRDEKKLNFFFKQTWPLRKDHYLLAYLAAVIDEFSLDKQELIKNHILKTFEQEEWVSNYEYIIPPVIFSEFRPDFPVGPLAACMGFFSLLNFSKERGPFKFLEKNQMLDLTSYRILTQDICRALWRNRVQEVDQTFSQTLDRALKKAAGIILERDWILEQFTPAFNLALALHRARSRIEADFYCLMENKPGLAADKHKRIASFWINIGCIYIVLEDKVKDWLDGKLKKFTNLPVFQPDINDSWEGFGFLLYKVGRNPGNKKFHEELKTIIKKPGNPELGRVFKVLKFK